MIHAYDESCLNNAKITLGQMFDYAVNDCKYDIDFFADLFIKSGYAKQFEIGNVAVIMGMSGVELAYKIVESVFDKIELPKPSQSMGKTPEYWAGWALADFQWFTTNSFKNIFNTVKMSDIVPMYSIYHEMDITQFYDAMNKKFREEIGDTNLKKIRLARGISQENLAKKSGVKLRSIQMYEQRNNDIDKAQSKTLYKLAFALKCSMEDLLEKPML